MPVMMSPLLKNSKSPDGFFFLFFLHMITLNKQTKKYLQCETEAMEQLNKGLKVVEENLVWNDKTMPATIANIQKHPGIPLASGFFFSLFLSSFFSFLIS